MYRATTPLHTFIFEVNPEATFKTILITYVQDDQIVLEKGKSDLTFTSTDAGYEATLQLTQEETKLFNNKSSVKVQVRVLTYSGEAAASTKMTIPVNDVLNDEVLT